MKALRYFALLLITTNIWFCLTPLAQAQDQCLAPEIKVLSGNGSGLFFATVQVTNQNDPVNGLLTIAVTTTDGGFDNPCPVTPQVPDTVQGTATFTFAVGAADCCSCRVSLTITDSCCGSSSTLTVVNFSRPDQKQKQPNFSISSRIAGAACTGIISVDIEPIALADDENKNRTGRNENKKIESFLDINPDWAGGGKRIFPDHKMPEDQFDRRTVRVKVHTSMPDKTMVYFKAFDVDDPTDDESPVDRTGPKGNDNRVETDPLEGRLSAASAKTQNGDAIVTFEVGMHPGNNYRIAASLLPIEMNTFNPDSGSTNIVDAQNKPIPTTTTGPAKSKASPLLTVWRKIHIEVEAMGPVINNKSAGVVSEILSRGINRTELKIAPTRDIVRFKSALFADGIATGAIDIKGVQKFRVIDTSLAIDNITVAGNVPDTAIGKEYTLYDDDDFNNNNAGNLVGDDGEFLTKLDEEFALLQESSEPSKNIYAMAFIEPVIDSEKDPRKKPLNVDFQINVDTNDPAEVNKQLNKKKIQSIEEDDYWVVYVQLCYQPNIINDADPNDTDYDKRYSTGVTPTFETADIIQMQNNIFRVPRGGTGTLIFIETSRDIDALVPGTTNYIMASVPHEIGHQFGLAGDKEGEFGIMGREVPFPKFFIRQHLDILRWRVVSPGQPINKK